jgi:hypothetical protein
MEQQTENIATLQALLPARCLDVVPWLEPLSAGPVADRR